MKILHVVPTYLPAVRYGGPIISVHGLCKSLVKLGHEVHVCTTNVDGDLDSNVPLREPVNLDGVLVHYFPSGIGRRLYYSKPLANFLKKSVKYYDLVHLHSVFLWPTWAAARKARKFKIPYLISPRGMLYKNLIKRKSFWIKSLWLRFIESVNIKNAAGIHVTSISEAEALKYFSFNVTDIINIPNGVDNPGVWNRSELSHDVSKLISKQPYVLYFGRLNWKKGLDRLIEAWNENINVPLIIAGTDDENYSKYLRDLLVKYGIEEIVTIINRTITGADKEALYANASLFVLPSYSENFGNTVLEAMIRKLAVVVTEEVGAKDIVLQANAGKVIIGDELQGTITGLLENKEECINYGKNGHEWVMSNLRWENIGNLMQQQYKNITTGNS